jgi:hypothetical protein
MSKQASRTGEGRLIQFAADAKCYGVPTRAWHSIFSQAIASFSGHISASLLPLHITAVPLAKGICADMQFAVAWFAALQLSNVHDLRDRMTLRPRIESNRSNGWKNMRNSSLSLA